MSETTIEEASRCPKCGTPGQLSASNVARGARGQRATVRTYTCQNETCKWFNTGWLIQLNPDGSIPDRTAGPVGGEKQFNKLTPDQLARGQRIMEDIKKQDMR